MTSTPTPEPLRLLTPGELHNYSRSQIAAGRRIGLVPTMGALHAGHASLVRRARDECDIVIVSIFVNPTQFGAAEDLDRYPRPLADDMALLASLGADAVFTPDAAAMYPPGSATTVSVGGTLTTTFEGALRPGHFDGVALVVSKLLAAAIPDSVYFGAKDAQQCAVVRRLITDLNLGCDMVVCPTVRDADGLALSSRNVYLDAASRRQALAIPRGLAAAHDLFAAGERQAAVLLAAVRAELDSSPDLHLDYAVIVDESTFLEVTEAGLKSQIVLAARISDTHLIDVLRLGADETPAVRQDSSPVRGEAPDVAGV